MIGAKPAAALAFGTDGAAFVERNEVCLVGTLQRQPFVAVVAVCRRDVAEGSGWAWPANFDWKAGRRDSEAGGRLDFPMGSSPFD